MVGKIEKPIRKGGVIKNAIQEAKKKDTKINLDKVFLEESGIYYATFTGYGIAGKVGVTIPLDATFYLINSYNYYAGEQGRKGNSIFIAVKDGNIDRSKLLFRWSYDTVTEVITPLPII